MPQLQLGPLVIYPLLSPGHSTKERKKLSRRLSPSWPLEGAICLWIYLYLYPAAPGKKNRASEMVNGSVKFPISFLFSPSLPGAYTSFFSPPPPLRRCNAFAPKHRISCKNFYIPSDARTFCFFLFLFLSCENINDARQRRACALYFDIEASQAHLINFDLRRLILFYFNFLFSGIQEWLFLV